MTGFDRFLIQLRKDLKQWVFFMLLLSLFRIVFILLFRAKINPATPSADILLTVLNGLRYDSMASTYWAVIPFLAGALSWGFNTERFASALRMVFGSAFIVTTTIAWVFTFVFFREYNEQFNHFIFNLYYDDTKAILLTIWSDYHPIPVFLGIGIVSAAAILLRNIFVKGYTVEHHVVAGRRFSPLFKTLTVVFVLLLIVVASRGSLGRRPAQRKDAGVSKDEFLNKAVVNPYFALLLAVNDHALQTGLAGLENYLPDRNVLRAAQEYFHDPRSLDDLDAYFLKHARGSKNKPPRHIFIVVMESYDAWPFLKQYASLGLTPNLSRLGRKGLFLESFLPASDGTMQSLTSIMTSLPYSHVEINYQSTALKPYPSSLATTFKRLGYRTRLFYGGYLSWQRFGDFAKAQGFEEIYGAPHMSAGVATHEWGVDDEYLLEFVARTVTDDQPSFTLIMTTSYHPPYNVDVWGKGFPLKEVPDDIKPMFDGTTDLKMLGHLWYSDKCLGEFVNKVETRLPRAIFAFTGDHYGRKFINTTPDFFERSGVPLILYGNDVLRGVALPRGAAGSHMDIGPTLIELAAPKGFEYYAVGQDLLAPRKEFLGIGWGRVIGKDFLFDAGRMEFHPLPDVALPKDLPDAQMLRAVFSEAYGIGWWRVRRGAKF